MLALSQNLKRQPQFIILFFKNARVTSLNLSG